MPETAASSARATGERWWLPIAALVLLVPTAGALALVSPPDAYTSLLLAPVSLLGGLLTLLSPLFVHFDRAHVEEVSEWEPSGWYYWMILPPLTLALPAVYVYQRHKHVGVP